MVKLNMKDKPLLLMINGEIFSVKEVSGKTNTKFLTIKATNITGQRKLTIHIDPRLINALKDENRALPYIQ